MIVVYISIFFVLLVLSAFFSSAETALLSLNQINLSIRAKKKKKARVIQKIIKNPNEFFSTILIGNNFVNIAAASISTVVFTRMIMADERWIMLISTVFTTTFILMFAEIIPKTYAFKYNEKLSYLYAYPIVFFKKILTPFVKITTSITQLVLTKKLTKIQKKKLTLIEIKHFLASETQLFEYNRDTFQIISEMIDIVQKGIKSIMTPRTEIIALESGADLRSLKEILLEKKLEKIPIYQNNLDNIIGIVQKQHITDFLLENDISRLTLNDISRKPLFISEYSSLHYALRMFSQHGSNIAVILDEYGTTIGILTLNDIFRELLGNIHLEDPPIQKIGEHRYQIQGNTTVEEINVEIHSDLPEKKDYTTISGLFIYHYGKLPCEGTAISIGDCHLTVKEMGERKIKTVILIKE